ncbi:MAG: DedA family protein [Rhodothermaceae bacterium]|nr:DedA family protein [Rhodothermaceae bacterium]
MFEEFTFFLVDWVREQPRYLIYLAFFLVTYLENVIPPVPGDLLVAFGGYLAAEQVLGFTPLLMLTTLASTLGFMTMYTLGYSMGDSIKVKRSRFWLFRYLDIKYMDRVNQWMNRWGQGVVLANRFLAGTRSVISLLAGISHADIKFTILNSTISSILWNTILLSLGWFIRENWTVIGEYLNIYGWFVALVMAVFIAFRVYFWYRKRKRKRQVAEDI